MTTSIIPGERAALETLASGTMARAGRRLLFGLLSQLHFGRVTIVDDQGEFHFGQPQPGFPERTVVTVHHPYFYSYTVFGGSIGSAEAYMAGYWSADDLTRLIRVIMRNQPIFEGMEKGWARLMAPVHLLFHLVHRNTLKGSRRNIVAHYDLGNDFYELFLDETLTYSCGIFETADSSLREASIAKYDRICRKLELTPTDHVLEIGTGWGGFAIHAAGRYGCRVTTTTISDRQHELASERIRAAGLSDRVHLLKRDYRKLKGSYDKLVSIEMIEAVGHRFLDTFLAAAPGCSRKMA